MPKKMLCREVRKLIQKMPKGGCEETLRLVSEHLSECEGCRSFHAGLQKMEKLLSGRKLRLDELARQSPISKSRILEGIAPAPARRARRLRPVWAGAAAILLVAIAGAAALLLRDKGTEPKVAVVFDTPTPPITRAMASAASDRTLMKLAELAERYEAPPPKLLSGPPASPRRPAVPRLLEKCSLQSEKTLRAIAQSRTNLTWRNES